MARSPRPIKPGDVVVLASAPNIRMTVESVTDRGFKSEVVCVWFVETALHKATFGDSVLKLVR